MRSADAAQRVRERIRDWVTKKGRGSLKQLAKAVPGKFGKEREFQTWASGIYSGRQDLRLEHLDWVAALMDVPPGELVKGYDRNCLELTMAETRLVEYFRALPNNIQQDWIRVLDFIFTATVPRKVAEKTKRPRRRKPKPVSVTPTVGMPDGNDSQEPS